MAVSSPTPHILRFEAYELDVRAGELRKEGRKIRLQGQPLQVLAALLKRPGELVTRDELRAELWPADTFVDFDHSLHNAIARIRETLGDSRDAPRYVETLPRRGYRFIGRVEGTPQQMRTGLGVSDRREIHSIAVLPLDDHSGHPNHGYFADGMTEALITSLAKIKALRVISRTTAMQYRGAAKSLPRIASELKVDAVIEGSVLQSGERVRIAVQLIDASTDQHLWAESYERDSRDVLALQSEIARQVANEIRVILTPEERQRLGSPCQVNPEAHELFLKGRHFWNKRTDEGSKRALSYFQRTIDCDPTFAQGYAGLADCYNILGYYNALSPLEAYPKAKVAAQKAAALDETLAEPHAALGVIKRDFDWDWFGAEHEFLRAIDLNPGYVEAHHWRSTLFSMLGRHAEGIQKKKQALDMDPLSVVIHTDFGRMLYFARNYDQSLSEYQAALDLDPHFASAHLWLAHAYQQKGDFDQAIHALETGFRLSGESPFGLARLAQGHALMGNSDRAHALLKDLDAMSRNKYVSPYDVAMAHVALQDKDEAFAWLEKAIQQRSLWLGYIKVEPQLDPLRSDPRFQHLVGRVGLAQG